MRTDAVCVYPALAKALADRGDTWTDLQVAIMVSPQAMVNRRKGTTPFTPLEKELISKIYRIKTDELFRREGE